MGPYQSANSLLYQHKYKYLPKIQATHCQSKTKNLFNNLSSVLQKDFKVDNEGRGSNQRDKKYV